MNPVWILADAPQPSWAGILGALAGVFTALALVITAVGGYLTVRSNNRKVEAALKNSDHERREEQEAIQARLAIIHTLVNSTLTAAMQAELDSTRRELLMMREVVRLRAEAGNATAEQDRVINDLEVKIAKLVLAMRDREEQARAAEMQIVAETQRRQRDEALNPLP